MKNVVILSASPRKGGNSDTLAERFSDGAKNAGHHVEKIFLRDKKVGFCLGCGVCNSTHRCVQKDDMAEILEKMLAADVIALATPVYFYSMNAQMKTLIDRTVPRHEDIRDKDFYFIMAAAEDEPHTLDKTLAGFRGFLECLPGARERGIIRGTGAWQPGDIQKNPALLREAFALGEKV